MSIIFIVQDKTGRLIRLTRKQWAHIAEHPEMANQVERVQETLAKPSHILTSPNDASRNYYVRYFKQAPVRGKFLTVMVKYLNGHGFVITAYYSAKPRP
jgi:hypothetical protein